MALHTYRFPSKEEQRKLPALAFSDTPAYQTLTPSQKRFADAFFLGRNCLLSGQAGTGKTYLMHAIYEFCEKNHIAVARTASTGVGAFNLGGQTLHSWAGLGLGIDPVEIIIAKVRKSKKVCDRIVKSKVLVIDEISMIKGSLLDKLDIVLKYIRCNNRPFGGIQVIAVGDFLQLPAIFKGDEVKEFAFQCRSWQEAEIQTYILTEIVRQDAASPFAQMLSKLRRGDVSDLSLLDSRVNAQFPKDEIEPVRIFCKNIDVSDYNRNRLLALPGQLRAFKCRDFGQPHHTEYFNKNCPAPETLELKVGAQVMLLSNIDTDNGYVNGSVGVVKKFLPNGIEVKFEQGTRIIEENSWEIREQDTASKNLKYKTVATRFQYPLRLAYASSVHKSQGCTLNRAIVDLTDAFAEAQVYVALSRVRNIESLSLAAPIPRQAIRVNPECLEFYEDLEENA